MFLRIGFTISFLIIIQGCAASQSDRYDYTSYLRRLPKSILILPPVNKTTELMASRIYLSTISRTIAERGYYVFPVAVVDAMMKDNGVPTPDEMAKVSLKKIQEVINPDAVLYLTILQWGTKYQIITTNTIVQVQGRLVDTENGIVLWEGEHTVVDDSDGDNSNRDLGQVLVAAIVKKMAGSIADPTPDLARKANKELFWDWHKGLLYGHRYKDYEQKNKNKMMKH